VDGATITLEYWSDTHMLYRDDLNQLEVWYRGVGDGSSASTDGSNAVIFARQVSTDGRTWSGREILHVDPGAGTVSPAVTWDADNMRYIIWMCTGKSYIADADAKNWDNGAFNSEFSAGLRVGGGTSITRWHWDVIKTDIGWEMVFCDSVNSKSIQYQWSPDGKGFSDPIPICQVNEVYEISDHGFYRPSLMKINGYYYVFHSMMDGSGRCGISLAYSSEPNNLYSLKGIDASFQRYFNVPTRMSSWMPLGTTFYDQNLKKVLYCFNSGGSGSNPAQYADSAGNIYSQPIV
jgi:hypothetical protein